jgi:transcriptional regulator with XRE-family HTH domain
LKDYREVSYWQKSVKIIIEVTIPQIGDRIREARKSLNISQTKAAAEADMSQANLNRIETEEAKGVPFETLMKIAEAIGIKHQLKKALLEKITETLSNSQTMKV